MRRITMRNARPGGRPPTSSTCSRIRWSRSTGTARRRSPISPSRGRSARTAGPIRSSCATTSPSAAARNSPPRTSSTASSGSRTPRSRDPMPGAPAPSRNCARTDPHTVEYELEEPFSELLLQLTMFTNVIHNKESVEALGKDYGIKGADGTGPWCFDHWQPRTEIVLKRHDAYKWGPSMYKNKGPVKFEKLVVKIVPEDSSRVAAMMSGQFDITHQFPAQFITQAKAAPMLTVTPAKPNFQLLYYGFKTTRPMVADAPRARSHEHRHQPRRDRQGHPARQCRSGLHHRRPGRARLRPQHQGHRQGRHRTGQGAARRSRLEAGYRRRPREGRHEARAEGLFHGQCQLRARRRRHPGLSPEDRRRLAPATLGLDHLAR